MDIMALVMVLNRLTTIEKIYLKMKKIQKKTIKYIEYRIIY